MYLLKRKSLIISQTKDFLFLLVLSTGFWFFFELINIILQNWSYVMLPIEKTTRYLGYVFSYATVLPAIFETAQIIEALGIFKNSKIIKIRSFKNENAKKILLIGISSFLLTILIPKIFFPLVWVSLIFVFEYFNLITSNDSLVLDINEGNGERVYTLFLAGIVCGLMWELFNWKAGAKWIYHLPYLNSPKLFEMPIAGYLGFGFFALECYSFYLMVTNIQRKMNLILFNIIIFVFVLLISTVTIPLIDKITVKVFTIQ